MDGSGSEQWPHDRTDPELPPPRLTRPYVLRDVGQRVGSGAPPAGTAPDPSTVDRVDTAEPGGGDDGWRAGRRTAVLWPARHRSPGAGGLLAVLVGRLDRGPGGRRRAVVAAVGVLALVGVVIMSAIRLYDLNVRPEAVDRGLGDRPPGVHQTAEPGMPPGGPGPGGLPSAGPPTAGASDQAGLSTTGPGGPTTGPGAPTNQPGVPTAGPGVPIDRPGGNPAGPVTPGPGGGGPTIGPTPRPADPPAPRPTPAQPRPTPTQVRPPVGNTRNAYRHIQAETFDAQRGTRTESNPGAVGGQQVGYVGDGDWLQFDNVDFTSTAPRAFTARLASGLPAGVQGGFQVRVDSRGNPPIVSFAVRNTGGWQSWHAYAATAVQVTGVHTVFVTFSCSRPDDMLNVDWILFNGPHG